MAAGTNTSRRALQFFVAYWTALKSLCLVDAAETTSVLGKIDPFAVSCDVYENVRQYQTRGKGSGYLR
jgi:hypothetical protein